MEVMQVGYKRKMIREMNIGDYEGMYEMWQITTKRALSESDSKENIQKYLERNKGCSFVAEEKGKIVGTVLAGHDGRRGFIYHMAVHPDYRRRKIAHQMAEKALNALKEQGIYKTHIFCYENNNMGQGFWKDFGFKKRDDIYVFAYRTDGKTD